uniref:uroporphyrinogen-III C-methyltransferase n=1 Tax=Dunaliella tertiolecta TaxID=3047 RepID=A0A7S3QRL3_DUNTE|mmetsp:Transcript_14069/g.38025  ORF Transcript_14069/g.38025 Transcript_14069/m.38025 type:complete len:298 (-) Transcript_14069:240-1133(-)|eukprot:CAMPEP_0202341366 /NCGR_PEP_ID=MMETSP1126-20121109/2397_1 /ASSEMBLY_ACC=CAM_ASM_000457 /TAXON_ID=3047 /ORGANISM="Dunaliella tertiolecta, Strain CCMP1320" /LENGTH=297 /DNA_ID=CAMNT_0048932183 /DNA_START=15 /DNA_END=908 /DNA_ORIENTATION=-
MLGARSFSSPIGSTIHPGGSNCTKGTARTHRKHALRRSQQAAGAHQLPSAQAAESAPAPSKGTCFLVGGGLGPVDHLTVKAAKLLQSAEVCVYDDLGAQGPLELLPPSCERVYVGKRGGKQSIKQPDIDRILVELCSQGRNVIRLKGGCPSVFSRVSSEMTALTAAGCPYEFVPGISSALAAPLMAGFPLTQAHIGTAFAVTSGHDLDQNWAAFAAIPTLVVLMAGRTLPQIGRKLLDVSWAPDTHVCIVRSAGTSEQQIWHMSLASVIADPPKEDLSPCIVVFGNVARLGLHDGSV